MPPLHLCRRERDKAGWAGSPRALDAVTFFFFGTLMDRDVLAVVLDRAVGEGELVPARLAGMRRVEAASRPYPVLVPDRDGVVEGMLLLRPSLRDEVRIRHFEDEEYVERRVAVRRADGVLLAARAFFAVDGLGRSDRPWSLASWASAHKVPYLRQCRKWMRDCEM
jgi:hypothetical protein